MKLLGTIEGERISYLNEPTKTGRICIEDYRKAHKKISRDKNSVFPDKRIFSFGSKIIRAKQFSNKESHFIECIEDGRTLWEVKHWAYLYTDIIEKNGCAIFGTDGMGSRLYCIDVETGNLLSETKTHHSGFYDFERFYWHNRNIVVYGKGTLIILNPITGEIIDEHKIPAKFLYRSFLKVFNGIAYCGVLTDNNALTTLCFEL